MTNFVPDSPGNKSSFKENYFNKYVDFIGEWGIGFLYKLTNLCFSFEGFKLKRDNKKNFTVTLDNFYINSYL